MTEHNEQAALFHWAEIAAQQRPVLGLLFAIPNAGKRTIGAARWMLAEGLRAGVPDVFLPCACGGYHGLFVEMKYGANRPTATQQAWIAGLRDLGYKVEICYSADDARAVIEDYLEMGS